jgi:hypothetical protein
MKWCDDSVLSVGKDMKGEIIALFEELSQVLPGGTE